MGRFDGVLIATDLDGTLTDDTGAVPAQVRSAIAHFIREGGRFTVCTGRTYQGFHRYDSEYINAPVLLTNGSMAYDYSNNSVVFFEGIMQEGFPLVRTVRDRFPQASVEMYAFNKTYAINMTAQSERHFTSQDIPYTVISDPDEAEIPWAKIMIGADTEHSPLIQQCLKENFSDPAFLPTNGSFIEIMKKGCDKGTGLLRLAKSLGISQRDTYAIGDGYNDIEMLDAAHMGFVPENGSPEALEHATHIVRSNSDGAAAHVIEILSEIYE